MRCATAAPRWPPPTSPMPPAQAATANRFAATVYIGLRGRAESVVDGLLLRRADVRIGRRPLAGHPARHTFERRVSKDSPPSAAACAWRCCARPGCRPCSARSAPCPRLRRQPRRGRRRRRGPRELGRRAVHVTGRRRRLRRRPPEPSFTSERRDAITGFVVRRRPDGRTLPTNLVPPPGLELTRDGWKLDPQLTASAVTSASSLSGTTLVGEPLWSTTEGESPTGFCTPVRNPHRDLQSGSLVIRW